MGSRVDLRSEESILGFCGKTSLIVKKVSFVWTLLDCVKVEIGETYDAGKRFWMKGCIFGPREKLLLKNGGKPENFICLFGHLTYPIFFRELVEKNV